MWALFSFNLMLPVVKWQNQTPNKLKINRKCEKQRFTCFVWIFFGSIIITDSKNFSFLTPQVKKSTLNALLSDKKSVYSDTSSTYTRGMYQKSKVTSLSKLFHIDFSFHSRKFILQGTFFSLSRALNQSFFFL